jgi:hypothetical protein
MVYRVPVVSRTQARAYLAFISQPADGDTVTIGDHVYTFRTVLSVSPVEGAIGLQFEVLIGGSTTQLISRTPPARCSVAPIRRSITRLRVPHRGWSSTIPIPTW